MQLFKKWIAPSLIAVTIMTLYQLLIAPTIRDMMDDWSFLHMARIQAIQQQLKQKQ